MKNNILIVLIAFLFLQSCQDFFTTTIKVDPPEHTEQLAIHGFFTAQDSLLKVSVATTVGLLGDTRDDINQVNDATVEVFSGATKVATLLNNTNQSSTDFYNFYFDLGAPLSQFGSEFELRVSHPDFPTASVTQQLPTEVIPEEITYIENAGVDEEGYPASGFDIKINDPAGEDNYYEITLLVVDTTFGNIYGYPQYLSSIDPATSRGVNYDELIISDDNFDGSDYTLRVTFDNYVTNQLLIVQWNSITRDQYLYSKSIKAYRDASDFGGPFAEPVSIYSNIDNGLGVFGVKNTTLIEIEK